MDDIDKKVNELNNKYSKKAKKVALEVMENPENAHKVIGSDGFKEIAENIPSIEESDKAEIKKVTDLPYNTFSVDETRNIIINKLRRGEIVDPDEILPPAIIDLFIRSAVINVSIAVSKIATEISKTGESQDKLGVLQTYLDIMHKKQ